MILNATNINSKEILENIVQQISTVFNNTWHTHSKMKQITKYSKEWWSLDCTTSLNKYQASGDIQY